MQHVEFDVATKYVLPLALVALACVCSAQTERVLYQFPSGSGGDDPRAGLVADNSGNLYGTTYGGGNSNCYPLGCGTVFELVPGPGGQWTEKVLYTFLGVPDGSSPQTTLVIDSVGNLYGTTQSGGTGSCDDGCGTIFEVSPNGSGGWIETTLYSFDETSGGPVSGLLLDPAGNLIGSDWGGFPQGSAVYELSRGAGGSWSMRTLYRLYNGIHSCCTLILDAMGNLYGSTDNCVDCGVFELSRVSPASGEWQFTLLYHFLGGGNGASPHGLVFDNAGNLFGTLDWGGNGSGIVFELKRSGQNWQESMIYNFCSRNHCDDGALPENPLSYNGGHFYGSTERGGDANCGTVFKVDPPLLRWKENVLYSFQNGGGDGCLPNGPVIFGPDGNLYGTTVAGGPGGYGTVFEIILSSTNR